MSIHQFIGSPTVEEVPASTGVVRAFGTVADLLADIQMGYAAPASVIVAVGQIITAHTYRYEVAAAAVVDQDATTGGGLKFYEAGPEFTTRGALQKYAARGEDLRAGSSYSANGIFYVGAPGSAMIPDLPGFIWAGEPYADHWGINTAPGTTDMRAAVQAGLDALAGTGKLLHLRAGAVYALGGTVIVPAGTGIEGNGATIRPLASAATTDIAADRPKLFDLSGQTTSPFTPASRQTIRGLLFISELTDAYILNGIHARNCKDVVIEDLFFTGNGWKKMVKVDSLTGKPKIKNILAVDVVSSTAHTGLTNGNGQITVVETDNDRVNGVSCSAMDFEEIDGRSILHTGAAATAIGIQTDVLTVQAGRGHRVSRISGEAVAEVVDLWASHCSISEIHGEDVRGVVLKLTHGAQHNIAKQIVGRNTKICVVDIGAGNVRDTAYNQLSGVVCDILNPANDSPATTAAIRFGDSGSTFDCHSNRVQGLVVNPGANGHYCVHSEPATYSNSVEGITRQANGATGLYSGAPTRLRVKEAIPTQVKATSAANQTVATATATKIVFGTEVVDRRGEFDASLSRWTCVVPGVYAIGLAMRMTGGAAPSVLMLYRNGGVIERVESGSIDPPQLNGEFLVEMATGDYLEGFVSQTSGANRDLVAGSLYVRFTVSGPV